MSEEKATRYVIFGAGAIGGALAVLLVRAGKRVICVARPAQAEFLRQGMRFVRGDEELVQKIDAVVKASELQPENDDVLLLTVKAQATAEAIADLAAVYPDITPVVCLQNGVTNEEIVARRFKSIYAALVFYSATQMKPDRILMTRGKNIAIGSYPTGVDTTAERIAADFRDAGFDAIASPYAMAMKWSKFVINLNNATYAITGNYVEQESVDDELSRLLADVREEGLRVLNAAGITVEPPSGVPSPIRISEFQERVNALRGQEKFRNLPASARTYPSMWQDLEIGRRTSEADSLNGVAVELGRQHNVPTPYNSVLLETINRMFAEGRRPGLYTPAELRALIEARAASA